MTLMVVPRVVRPPHHCLLNSRRAGFILPHCCHASVKLMKVGSFTREGRSGLFEHLPCSVVFPWDLRWKGGLSTTLCYAGIGLWCLDLSFGELHLAQRLHCVGGMTTTLGCGLFTFKAAG